MTNTAGEPIIGATVLEKGNTTNGTITDIDGNFTINLPANATLSISYIGYITQEIQVGYQTSFKVVLKDDTKTLDEIIVVGYGSQKKANLTGAVSSVKMDEALGDRPLLNAADALQGAVPGLFVSNGGNAPGTSKSFQIRGAYSLGVKNSDGTYGNTIKPLVLIDNVEGDIDMINPEDIESINVLKDAASAAIYGARAAGGVILVTTKRPKGASRFELNYNNNQLMNNHYQRVIETAAKHHIMVNAHEATRPTGICRTWPNLVGNESARGTEYEAFGGSKSYHTVMLPFTRLQGGPMDYTPGIFETKLSEWSNNKSYVHTTLCGQLSLYLVMYSPLQMAADLPEHYEKYDDAFQFIRDVACDWDDSKYLEAEPAKYITVARKAKGTDNWFVGGKTDAARTAVVKLDFLDKGKKYVCAIYQDGKNADYEKNPKSYKIVHKTVKKGDVLKINEARGGGFAISLLAK